ncbi:MAG: RNA methyltransferase [Gemmatimonadota bacterium]|nr:RNA methyltransferase [Gemmatimonadota bacterium]
MASNLVTQVRNLQRRKGRKRRGLAVAEGVRLVEDALAAGIGIQGAVIGPTASTTDRGARLVEQLAAHAVPIEEVTEKALLDLADTDTPQGVLAVIDPPRWELDSVQPARGHPVLVLDGVQDPGNVGTLVRTAFGLGAPGVLVLSGTADLTNPKVMRAGMGATFRLPCVPVQDGEFEAWVRRSDVELWAAAVDGVPVTRVEVSQAVALVIGNEGAGVRPSIRSLARHLVSIPLVRGAESLNVAVAAGILMHEVRRVG